ncbi:hypothetical protein [Swingsia samuiensis]|uniref:DUF1351 domain-containing protein n=1 Tax=Swingsia samuiensis TaxID=1293412 RepID=A0A4Y6UN25_9PROT|nr:hypothetical protein [Swingsia samuiensis]QDH17445.1 hypothetical protein E3D00_07615 [Swingsia samuiensis]
MNDRLMVITKDLQPSFFEKNGEAERVVNEIKTFVLSIQTDATTDKGRKEIKSLAHKISRSKTFLDDLGKKQKEDILKRSKIIDSGRKYVRDSLDVLRDDIRRPVDEYEAREANRVEQHRDAIKEIERLPAFDNEPEEQQVKNRITRLGELAQRDFEEFSTRASEICDSVRDILFKNLKEAEQRRVIRDEERREQEEKERIEQERLKIEQAERERRIAQEAEERAASVYKIEIEKEREKAKREIEERIQRENRIAKEEERRRLENIEYRKQVNNGILNKFIKFGIANDKAKEIIIAIASGEIPNVKITY